MNRILVILTIHTDKLPENFQEIIKHEREVIALWKEAGFLDQLFLRPAKNGAVLIFKNIDETKVNELMPTLPLYQLMKSIEVLPLIKDATF
ncbi:MAG: muconolactone Delta-isomerase family protein [Bacteroidota bacterium]